MHLADHQTILLDSTISVLISHVNCWLGFCLCSCYGTLAGKHLLLLSIENVEMCSLKTELIVLSDGDAEDQSVVSNRLENVRLSFVEHNALLTYCLSHKRRATVLTNSPTDGIVFDSSLVHKYQTASSASAAAEVSL